MEVLIANTTDAALTLTPQSITDINGTPAPSLATLGFTVVNSSTITQNIDGVNRTFVRKIVKFDKLPFEGTQTVTFQVGNNQNQTGKVTFNILFGPFLKYDTIYDGMSIKFDSTKLSAINTIITNDLSNFAGLR